MRPLAVLLISTLVLPAQQQPGTPAVTTTAQPAASSGAVAKMDISDVANRAP
jgi:hypothetical protein